MAVHRLSKQQARRIAIRAQLLAHPRPTDLVSVARWHLDSAVRVREDLATWLRVDVPRNR